MVRNFSMRKAPAVQADAHLRERPRDGHRAGDGQRDADEDRQQHDSRRPRPGTRSSTCLTAICAALRVDGAKNRKCAPAPDSTCGPGEAPAAKAGECWRTGPDRRRPARPKPARRGESWANTTTASTASSCRTVGSCPRAPKCSRRTAIRFAAAEIAYDLGRNGSATGRPRNLAWSAQAPDQEQAATVCPFAAAASPTAEARAAPPA